PPAASRARCARRFAFGELLPPPLRGLAALAASPSANCSPRRFAGFAYGELLPPPLRGLAALASFRVIDASGSVVG
ncbi:MAG TPA: hypothetical protein VH062_04530, partial [Polyangiaceae bacterium]|nr:hypothetical protein [Polyangiaceae bacterium]